MMHILVCLKPHGICWAPHYRAPHYICQQLDSEGFDWQSHSCGHAHAGGLNGAECLRLKPGMEQVASRFETRRYLAYLGGTTEFTKWEGKQSNDTECVCRRVQ